MQSAKPWWASKTIWAAVVAFVAAVTGALTALGIHFEVLTPDGAAVIAGTVTSITGALASLVAVLGRVRATAVIGTPKPRTRRRTTLPPSAAAVVVAMLVFLGVVGVGCAEAQLRDTPLAQRIEQLTSDTLAAGAAGVRLADQPWSEEAASTIEACSPVLEASVAAALSRTVDVEQLGAQVLDCIAGGLVAWGQEVAAQVVALLRPVVMGTLAAVVEVAKLGGLAPVSSSP